MIKNFSRNNSNWSLRPDDEKIICLNSENYAEMQDIALQQPANFE